MALPSRCNDLDERFYKMRDTFSAPRFKALYQVWQQEGETVLDAPDPTRSTTLSTPARMCRDP
jgi:hypothetical protein